MPFPNSSASPNSKVKNSEHLPAVEIDELLTRLQHSHALYYKMMNLEVWAIVETLEQFFPGSWGQFMGNRKVAMKQFLQRQQAKNVSVVPSVCQSPAAEIVSPPPPSDPGSGDRETVSLDS